MTSGHDTPAIALVGCGYACDFYLATLAVRPDVSVTGVYDIRPQRTRAVATHWGATSMYASLEELLEDERVEIVVNLTPPAAQADITRRALLAGRHVYSEKPLATSLETARELVEISEAHKLLLSSAPCNHLGVSLQTLRRAILDGVIGTPLTVYAELDDGAVPLMPHHTWLSASGARWPAEDELATGCVLQHAGYHLGWMTSLLGSVRRVTVLSGQLGTWGGSTRAGSVGTDFSTALLQFDAGVVARLTCSTIAPRDHSISVVGELGVLSVADCWDYWSPVELRRVRDARDPAHRLDYLDDPETLAPVTSARWSGCYDDTHRMDFALGVVDLAEASRTGRTPNLNARHVLHILDVTLSIDAATDGAIVTPTTSVPISHRRVALADV